MVEIKGQHDIVPVHNFSSGVETFNKNDGVANDHFEGQQEDFCDIGLHDSANNALTHHDTGISSTSSNNNNDLTVLAAATLLLADVVGTGILALPHDIAELGTTFGLFFLLLNAPINAYAGTILCRVASCVERQQERQQNEEENEQAAEMREEVQEQTGVIQEVQVRSSANNSNINQRGSDNENDETEKSTFDLIGLSSVLFQPYRQHSVVMNDNDDPDFITSDHRHQQNQEEKFSSTTQAVVAAFYANIFLLLGNYILVMSRAVLAIFGEDNMCLTTAGVIASILMFGIAQLDTMAKLGKSATNISITALIIVVVQCLIAVKQQEQNDVHSETKTDTTKEETYTDVLMRQIAALASVAFAFGSQKLLLNIRHEMSCKEKAAPESLSIALVIIALAYVVVCLLAGPNPPGFLFDAIPVESRWQRRIAGFLLWIHVAVSYAINNQALCSSIDRLVFQPNSLSNDKQHRLEQQSETELHAETRTQPQRHREVGISPKCWNFIGRIEHRYLEALQSKRSRWVGLTLVVAISSFLLANAIPFFKDLVALIGSLTTIPLTLLLPALFHRKVQQIPLWKPPSLFMISSASPGQSNNIASYVLLIFSVIFLIVGLIGSLGSIELDWSEHGPPFACS